MWSNTLVQGSEFILASTVPPETTTTTTLSSPVGAMLIVLAAYGALCMFLKSPPAKSLVILVLAGIVVVYVGTLLRLGESFRGSIADGAVRLGFPELAGELTFSLFVLLALVLATRLKKGALRTVAIIVLSLVFFTLSWAREAIVWIIENSNAALAALGGLGF